MKENLVDLILDRLNKVIREDCVGTTITDRTELFSASTYNDAKEEVENLILEYLI